MRRLPSEAPVPELAQRPAAARLWERALDLVFPPRCVSCNGFGAFICDRCLGSITKADHPRCLVCWMPVLSRAEGPVLSRVEGPTDESVERRECGRCRARPPAFKAVRSVFVYEGAARDAVHALKFRGLSAVAHQMAALMAVRLLEWDPPVQAVVPVPLAGRRRRLRGYDQSGLLAKDVSRLTGIPLARSALVRLRATAPQVHQVDEGSRRRNVAGAFGAGSVPAGGLLLIDDVVTTGATLDACARVLINEAAGPVFALTFARED